jgi:predicted DNA-binding protein (UPF0251 family)
MSGPEEVGPRLDVRLDREPAEQLRVRPPTADEVADVLALRAAAAQVEAARSARLERVAQARKRVARAMAAGQGGRPVTVADLADMFAVDPDPNA